VNAGDGQSRGRERRVLRSSRSRSASASASVTRDASASRVRGRTRSPSRDANLSLAHVGHAPIAAATVAALTSPSTSSIAKPPLETIPDDLPTNGTAVHSPLRTTGHDLSRFPTHISYLSQIGSPSQVSLATTSETESLYRRNTQFARLVAGEESEIGEAPPSYSYDASRCVMDTDFEERERGRSGQSA
jgi:hypothetical protein